MQIRSFIPLFMGLLAVSGCGDERRQLGQALSGKPPVVAGSLIGRWQLADLNGGGPVAGGELAFTAGEVGGTAGCNRATGRWTYMGGTLAIGPLATTRMACDPAVMAVEGRVFALLAAARAVTFDDRGNAVIGTPDGRRLRLIPVLPEPTR